MSSLLLKKPSFLRQLEDSWQIFLDTLREDGVQIRTEACSGETRAWLSGFNHMAMGRGPSAREAILEAAVILHERYQLRAKGLGLIDP